VIQGARIAGAAVIVAVDPVPGRREASIRAGATHAVGRTELMAQAFDMARAEGTVTLVGMPQWGRP